ncbi:hypothetical protein FRC14_004253 [Serendipita sp. 396]|nr:hypothetical protein FRC14_004253 [Serendipita sp. 396]KAG8866862.1 hypothetical protein FRC20_007315 [Serendipita sp. 405]
MSFSGTDDEPGFAGGLSNPETTQYKLRRQVIDIVNHLMSYGLQHKLDLPGIAVIGSQSVGKSSLIESISGITLPRATGTCTRCPIECRLSRVDREWSCEVYLLIARELREVKFGDVIKDKRDVEDRIRRAQLAVLNPSKDPLKVLDGTAAMGSNELSFSTDVVSVRISGRNVDDLSFVDLPGIIVSVRDGNKDSDIDDVRNLVTGVIKKPSCLILLVISCESDIENQGARRLAKQLDPTGDRTIPVLTKPDRIAAGSYRSWLDLLENKEERFKHGWYCVKQADQEQLEGGITWEDARKNERSFFDKKAPWSQLDERIRSRLGTPALTNALGNTLFDLIVARLPGLLREVEARLETIQKELAKLPSKVEGDPVTEVWKMIEEFKSDVQALVLGRAQDGEKGLIQNFRASREEFRESIFQQAPDFKPYDCPAGLYGSRSLDVDQSISSTTDDTDSSGEGATGELERLEPSGTRNPKTLIYIDEVMDMARNAATRELPENYPYAVKTYFVGHFMKNWHIPTEKLYQKIERLFSDELTRLVTKHFSRFAAGAFDSEIQNIVMSQLEACSTRAKERIRACIALEQEEPFTINEHYLQDYKTKYTHRYKAARRHHVTREGVLQQIMSGQVDNTESLRNALFHLGELGFDGLDVEKLLRLLPPDPADAMIEIMAEVRAYYQVAFKRFVDNISMIIDYELLKVFYRTLSIAILTKLSSNGADFRDRCNSFLNEDPSIVNLRDSLTQDYKRFESARLKLQNIPGVSVLSAGRLIAGDDMDSF